MPNLGLTVRDLERENIQLKKDIDSLNDQIEQFMIKRSLEPEVWLEVSSDEEPSWTSVKQLFNPKEVTECEWQWDFQDQEEGLITIKPRDGTVPAKFWYAYRQACQQEFHSSIDAYKQLIRMWIFYQMVTEKEESDI